MQWLLLIGAILTEVTGTLSLRYSEGFTRPLPSVVALTCYGAAFYLLSLVLGTIDLHGAATLLLAVTVAWLTHSAVVGRYTAVVVPLALLLLASGRPGCRGPRRRSW